MKTLLELIRMFTLLQGATKLKRLDELNLTLSIDKLKFKVDENVVIDYLCEKYNRKFNPNKISNITVTNLEYWLEI